MSAIPISRSPSVALPIVARSATAAGRSEAPDRVALMAAALAPVALDALSDEEFFAAVRKEHSAAGGART